MPETNPIGEAIAKAARDDYANRERGHIDIPEWSIDGQPSRIWFRPMTMAEAYDIRSYKQEDGPQYAQVYAIIIKAEDELGKRLFTLEHEQVLLKQVAVDVVRRISDAILAGPRVATAKKD